MINTCKNTLENSKRAAHLLSTEDDESHMCTGDDNYKPNTGYVIGLDQNNLYSHFLDKIGVIRVGCVLHACTYEHFTDAKIGIHGLYKDGIEEAKNYKIYKVVCQLQECGNYENDEGE